MSNVLRLVSRVTRRPHAILQAARPVSTASTWVVHRPRASLHAQYEYLFRGLHTVNDAEAVLSQAQSELESKSQALIGKDNAVARNDTSNGTGTSSGEAMGHKSSQRTQFLKALKRDYGDSYETLTVPTKELLSALRDMQSWRQLTPSTAKSADFRDSLRSISLLAGPDGGITKPNLKLKDIEAVLSDENGVTWRLIRHLIEHGLVPELEALDDKWKAMVMFNRVHGFGKIRAAAYVEAGARTLDDLLNAKDKEWGRKVSDAQKLAITYHEEMDLMIPRSEVAEFEELIRASLSRVDPTLGLAIMGSYRRGEFVSSDIDMVVWHESFLKRDKDEKRSSKKGYEPDGLMGRVIKALFDARLLDEETLFSRGEKKVLALARLPRNTSFHRQIDIRLCPLESLPYMLLGNTGDDTLMKILRHKAMAKGWVLNEYAMGERLSNDEGTEIIVKSEKEIFDLLGVPFLEVSAAHFHHQSTPSLR
ncbi:hypothetical protein I317_03998 [Kwoniella heveanensis CBS 569]|nr:hypothetical protein I317_03998 [Kwoniella heveanensis CBS 569]